jgi:hypothetical protein
VAVVLLLALLWIASWHPWAHPIWLAPLGLCLAVAWRRPHLGLNALLALLPVASQGIWSGWRVTDEFDLLLMAVLAAGHGRLASDLCAPVPTVQAPADRRDWLPWLLLAGLLASTAAAAWRGWNDQRPAAGWGMQDWLFGDYDSPANVWRVGKSVLWLLLAVPWLHQLARLDRDAFERALCRGMLTGLVLVCGLAVWERYAYVGLWDFEEPYRTTAWFWEMHVGGGAIDAYMVLASPFGCWALWQARSRLAWMAAAVLLTVLAYVLVTIYSRGLYLAVLGGFCLMGVMRWRSKLGRAAAEERFGRANRWLAAWLCAECLFLLTAGGEGFATSRLSQSQRDLASRWEHWTAAAALLDTPQRRWLGLGLGRLPAHYSRRVPSGEFPGAVGWLGPDAGGPAARLSGPATQTRMARSFALAQRVSIAAPGPYRVRLWARAAREAELGLRLCQRHLLYGDDCQSGVLRLDQEKLGSPASAGHVMKDKTVELQGPDLLPSPWPQRARQGLLALSVLDAGRNIEIEKIELLDSFGRQLLKNADFVSGLSNWLPVADNFFRSWHLDNFYMELWIERGWPGLIAWTALLAFAVLRLLVQTNAAGSCRLSLLGGLTGAGALGMVISMAELSRIAFLLAMLSFSALVLGRRASG